VAAFSGMGLALLVGLSGSGQYHHKGLKENAKNNP
jgi:hypothetical protein